MMTLPYPDFAWSVTFPTTLLEANPPLHPYFLKWEILYTPVAPSNIFFNFKVAENGMRTFLIRFFEYFIPIRKDSGTIVAAVPTNPYKRQTLIEEFTKPCQSSSEMFVPDILKFFETFCARYILPLSNEELHRFISQEEKSKEELLRVLDYLSLGSQTWTARFSDPRVIFQTPQGGYY